MRDRHEQPRLHTFRPGETVPNSPLPLLHYRFAAPDCSGDPGDALERLFRSNGWHGLWRNGIYDFEHYHATAHEVLGVACGRASVRFGGRLEGEVLELETGDIVVLPAGTGHCRIAATEDLQVIGGYPPGQTCDIVKAGGPVPAAHWQSIAATPIPDTDPVLGPASGLVRIWRDRR